MHRVRILLSYVALCGMGLLSLHFARRESTSVAPPAGAQAARPPPARTRPSAAPPAARPSPAPSGPLDLLSTSRRAPVRAVLQVTPEDSLATVERFSSWTRRYFSAASDREKRALLTEGLALAKARREALAEEIRRNPSRALELAAPWRWRHELPEEVAALLEESISGRGKLEVYCALPLPGADYKEFAGGAIRYVTLNHKTYRAYVYGRRLRQMSRKDIALHGIAVDNSMAVSEEPLRTMEADEAQAALANGKPAVAPVCALCGVSSSDVGRPVLADYGSQVLSFCHESHVAELSRALVAAEETLAVTSASSGVGDIPPPASLAPTSGTKKVLYMRVIFPDDTAVPISEAEAADVMHKVNDFYVEASYNKTALISTITPVLTLAQPKLYYSVNGPGAILADAQTAAAAAGFAAQNYDQLMIRHPNVPGFTWGGLGGGGVSWLQSSGAGVAVHELGHNYGLAHANFWDTRRDALPPNPNNLPFDVDSLVGHDCVIGAGDDVAYGDIFDVMGGGGGESPTQGNTNIISSLTGHFNVVGKSLLGWLPDAFIPNAGRDGTNRLYVHDTPRLVEGRSYALKVRKDEQRTYWVSARSRFPGNPWLQNGVELHWAPWQQALGYSHLLDTTPGSKPGRDDSAILIGRTFSDPEADVHITPVAKGGSGTESWFDVVVNLGPFSNNVPPTVEMAWTTNQVAVGRPVTFTADATDANGDRMAVFWDFGDGAFGTNVTTISKAWIAAGDYVVRCEVSDMKGGLTSKHVVVRVGAPDTLRIRGRVIDSLSHPVQGARVHNGSLTNNDLAFDYQWTYTDSDGAFTLVNLTNGTYAIGAYLQGYTTKPFNFDLPLTLTDRDAVDVQFLAQPWPRVTVRATADASKVAPSPGAFELTRTGDTNTALRALFLLSGTAGPKEYQAQAAPKTTSQTNVNPNPFGPVTNVYKFQYVDFATGVFTTNITITPAGTAAPGEDKYVSLTVMNPLQAQRITLVATNWVNFTGWEIVNVNNQDTWFQTYPDYLPAFQSEAKVFLRGQPPTQPTISILATNPTASENGNDAGLFTLMRFGRLDLPVLVTLQIGGSATGGSDYEALPATVTIPAGQTLASLPVIVRPNLYLDGNKTVEVAVVPKPSYLVGNASATVTIGENDQPLVTLVAADGIADEATGKPATLVVTRSGDLIRDLVVNYLVTGTAVSGQDYRVLPGSVTIPAGQPSANITVTPRNNRRKEGDLTVVVFLSDTPTYNIGLPNRTTVLIQDGSLPTVTLAATVDAAGEGGATGEFTVTRTGDLSRELWVDFHAGGTAKPLADYAAIGDRVRIAAGASRTTITLTPVDDPFREDPETVTLQLLSSPEYNLGPASQATVTVTDNDSGLPAVGFNLLTSSGAEAAGQAELAVSVSANPAENADVTVDYQVTGGSAIPEVDYAFNSSTGRLVFPYNPNTGEDEFTNRMQVIKLLLLDNTNAQPDRTLIVTLIEPFPNVTNELVTNIVQDPNDPNLSTTNISTNIIVTPIPINAYFDTYKSHTFTILDDDASVVIVEATDRVAREAGLKAGLFTIRRTNTKGPQKVYFQLSGAAANGSDYETIDSPVEIPAGHDSVTVPVIPVDDQVQEYLEDATLTLLSVPGAQIGSGASATVSITDNDGTTEFTATAYSVLENVGVAQLPIRRTGDTSSAATVDYVASAGTATADVDFVAASGTVTFEPGENLKYVPITILDETSVEPQETVNLTLRNASNGAPLGGQDTAVLTILDDDTTVEFTQPAFRVNENATHALISVHRIGVATNAFTIGFFVTNAVVALGVAAGDADYALTNGTLSFAPGQLEATFQVRILDDALLEGDETALLVLTNSTGNAVLGTQAAADLLIVDDECYLEFAAATLSVEEYARTVAVNVRRGGGTVNPITVDFATQPATAKPNRDYLTASGTLTFSGDAFVLAPDGSGLLEFQPGETNKTFQVRILDNIVGDGDRDFLVALAKPRGPANALTDSVTLGSVTNTVVTILDNETPGNVDYEFNPGEGTDANVLAVALQPDGKVALGGDFTTVDGVVLNHIARLHDDGYLDSFFNPGGGTDNPVSAVAVQLDGRILIGGDFTQVSTVSRSRIARLNADGTLDGDFDPPGGANATVRAIAVQADGAILIGGDFTTVNGSGRDGIARLNRDGSLDRTFDPGAGATGGAVLALASLAEGKVLVGGSFASLGNAGAYLARLNADGSSDSSFPLGGGPNRPVRTLAVQEDGRLVIGGEFNAFGAAVRNGIVRLNPDGSLDTSFDPGAGTTDVVYAVGVQADGKVILGGAFTNFNGAALNRLARLNPDGSVDDAFDIGNGANDTVRTLVVQPDTAIVIGGDFTVVRDLPRNHIARLHGDEKFVLNKVQFSSANYQVPETGGQAAITVRRSGDTTSAISVGYLTADGTATAGLNYVATKGTLQFNGGEGEKTFAVPVLNDGAATGNLTVNLLLTNVPPGFTLKAQLTAVLTIADVESAVAFSLPNFDVNESDGTATITVRRTGPVTETVSVDFTAREGTAANGLDFTAVNGTLTFAPGQAEQTFSIPILNDSEVEDDETVQLELSNPRGGAVLGRQSTAALTIHDDDRVQFYSLNLTPPIGGTTTPPSGPYPVGSVQVLTAAPDRDYEFAGWEGTTNSTLNPLMLTMNRNYALTAVFRATSSTYVFEPPFGSSDLAAGPWANFGYAPWEIQSVTSQGEGRSALRSAAIADGGLSQLDLVVNTRAGAGSFDLRVSSEKDWDFLEFYVNDVRVQRWSGEVSWRTYQFVLPPGRNRLSWRYVKDANFSSGLDAAFIDNLYVPLDVPDPANPAALLSLVRLPDDSLLIQLQGQTARIYVLEASPDLLTWEPISTNLLTGATKFLSDPQASKYPVRFYRAVTR